MAIDTNSQLIVNHLYDGLVSWSLEDGIQPMIAKSWKIQKDGQEIVFDLHENATFSDGSVILGQDVIHSFHRLMRGENPFQHHFQNLMKVELVDRFRIKFSLKKRDTKFLFLLAGVPALISKVSKNGSILFSGPYVVSEKTKDKISLLARSDYYGQHVSTKELHFITAQDGYTLDQMIQEDIIDDAIIDSNPMKLKRTSHDKWVSAPMWTTWAIGFDVRNPSVRNKDIRLAMAKVLTSDKFIESIYPSQSKAFGVIPFGVPGFLNQAVDFDSKMEGLDHFSMGTNVDLYIPSEVPNKEEILQWLKNRTSNLGFHVNIIDTSFSQMIKYLGKGKMSSFLLSFNAEFPSPSFFVDSFISSGSSNFYGLDKKIVLNLMKKKETDQDADPLKRLNTYLVSEAYVIPLMHVVHNAWMKDCVTGIKFSPISEGYFSFRGVKNSCSKK